MVSSEIRETLTSLHMTGFEILMLAETVRMTVVEAFGVTDLLLEEVGSMTELVADEAASISDFLFEEMTSMTGLLVEAAGWMADMLSQATASVMEF